MDITDPWPSLQKNHFVLGANKHYKYTVIRRLPCTLLYAICSVFQTCNTSRLCLWRICHSVKPNKSQSSHTSSEACSYAEVLRLSKS